MTVQDISPAVLADGPITETESPGSATRDVGTEAFARVATIRTHGTSVRAFSIPGLTGSSTLSVSITEVDGAGNPFVGDAVMRVDNVAPGNGVVNVRIEVGWGVDLTVRLNFFVF
jgi:hypothetical protein